ncbi:MAG: protein kinase [Planctomycetota bacterium]
MTDTAPTPRDDADNHEPEGDGSDLTPPSDAGTLMMFDGEPALTPPPPSDAGTLMMFDGEPALTPPPPSDAGTLMVVDGELALTPPPPSDAGTLMVVSTAPPITPPVDSAPPATAPSATSAARGTGSGLRGETLVGGAGRYSVRGEIGRGGMGVVLRGFDPDARREVAIKRLLGAHAGSAARARFLAEAQVTAQLEHPAIVPVHEIGIDADGQLFFTMKFVRGESLAEKLSAAHKQVRAGAKLDAVFPLPQRLEIIRRIAEAIAFAHDRGVIHRDLKPANVMVGEFGEVLVMDWGLARAIDATGPDHAAGTADSGSGGSSSADRLVRSDRDDSGQAKTMDGVVAGTPAYMSPEQARGEIDQLDARSDIYALGAVLYELLTLTPPYADGESWVVVSAVRKGEFDPPVQRAEKEFGRAGVTVPRELEAVVLRAMAARREARYATATSLIADIDAWLAGRTLAAVEYSPAQLLLNWAARHRAVVIPAAAAVLMLAVMAVIFLVNLKQERDVAEEQRRLAEQRRVAAEAATAVADTQRKEADTQRAAAETSRGQMQVALDLAIGSRALSETDPVRRIAWLAASRGPGTTAAGLVSPLPPVEFVARLSPPQSEREQFVRGTRGDGVEFDQIAFSQDGRWLVTADATPVFDDEDPRSEDLLIFDVRSPAQPPRLVRVKLAADESYLRALSVSSDARRAAMITDRWRVLLVDLTQREPDRVYPPPPPPPDDDDGDDEDHDSKDGKDGSQPRRDEAQPWTMVSFRGASDELAIASRDRVRVVDWRTLDVRTERTSRTSDLIGAQFEAGGRWLVVRDGDRLAVLDATRDWRELRLYMPMDDYHRLSFSADGRWMVGQCRMRDIGVAVTWIELTVRDEDDGRQSIRGTRALSVPVARRFDHMVVSGDGRFAAGVAWGQPFVSLIDRADARLHQLFNHDEAPAGVCAIGDLLATNAVDGVARLWRFSDLSAGDTTDARAIALSGDGRVIALLDADTRNERKNLRVLSVAGWRPIGSGLCVEEPGYQPSLALDHAGERLLAFNSSTLQLIDTATSSVLAERSIKRGKAVFIGPADAWMVAVSDDAIERLDNSLAATQQLEVKDIWLAARALAADCLAVFSGDDRRLHIVDLSDRAAMRDRVLPVVFDRGRTRSLALDPPGRLAAVGEWRRIRLIDIDTGQVVRTLDTKCTGYVAFTPDRRLLICSDDAESRNDVLEVFDLESGQRVATGAPWAQFDVAALIASPDGTGVICSGPRGVHISGTGRIFNATSAQLASGLDVDLVKKHARRCTGRRRGGRAGRARPGGGRHVGGRVEG